MNTDSLIGMKCNIEPTNCGCCLQHQSDFSVVLDCRECELRNKVYTIMEVLTSFWGSKVIVKDDKGKLDQVNINRVRVLEEEK